ncbi:hypothetical protein [Spirosoma spitsbergense]|nr:hypothetical protein [Spirosoma spitsbergense]
MAPELTNYGAFFESTNHFLKLARRGYARPVVTVDTPSVARR